MSSNVTYLKQNKLQFAQVPVLRHHRTLKQDSRLEDQEDINGEGGGKVYTRTNRHRFVIV